MSFKLNTPIGRLRLATLFEGFSLILLVFVAMPIKYGLGIPIVVKVLGPIHGALFILFASYAIIVSTKLKWDNKTTFVLLISSFIPFANFYVDKKFLKPKA